MKSFHPTLAEPNRNVGALSAALSERATGISMGKVESPTSTDSDFGVYSGRPERDDQEELHSPDRYGDDPKTANPRGSSPGIHYYGLQLTEDNLVSG